MKALEILRRTLDNCYLTEVDEIMEAIAELEELENRSCESCIKGFNCPIFKKVWKDKLKKDGYLISHKEFDCRFWESKQ